MTDHDWVDLEARALEGANRTTRERVRARGGDLHIRNQWVIETLGVEDRLITQQSSKVYILPRAGRGPAMDQGRARTSAS